MAEAARSPPLRVLVPSPCVAPEEQACAPPQKVTLVFCPCRHMLLREIKELHCVAWSDGHFSVPCVLVDQLAFDVLYDEIEVDYRFSVLFVHHSICEPLPWSSA